MDVFDQAQARARVRSSALSVEEQDNYLILVDRFPDATFFANSPSQLDGFAKQQKVKLPEWFRLYRTTLAEAYRSENELLIRFDRFSTRLDVGTPSRFDLSDTWYELSFPGLPRKGQERQALLKGSESLKLLPIGLKVGDHDIQLGINLDDRDTRIYEFSMTSVFSSYAKQEDISIVSFPVFASPGDLLSHIVQIKHDGIVADPVE